MVLRVVCGRGPVAAEPSPAGLAPPGEEVTQLQGIFAEEGGDGDGGGDGADGAAAAERDGEASQVNVPPFGKIVYYFKGGNFRANCGCPDHLEAGKPCVRMRTAKEHPRGADGLRPGQGPH